MPYTGKKPFIILLAILIAAAGWKALLLWMDAFPFNADEAVVALMARHILQGERPVFFYGQAYMGSLDAFLVAAGFFMFGQKVWVIRLVQTLLYLATIISVAALGRRLFNDIRVGLIAAAMMAIPALNATLYTTVSLGGYGEALLIGALLMLVSVEIRRALAADDLENDARAVRRLYVLVIAFGVLAGVGLWANGLTLVFAAPAGLYWLWMFAQKWRWVGRRGLAGLIPALIAGFLAGSAPWWLYAMQAGVDQLLVELFGSAVSVYQGSWFSRTLMHLFSLVLLGVPAALGLRPPWEVRLLALPLLPFALAIWIGVGVYMFRQALRHNACRPEFALLAGVLALVAAGFVLTPFGTDPSGRYFLPWIIPLSLAAGHLVITRIPNRAARLALVGVVLAFNLWGTLDAALRYPPGITTQFDLQTAVDHRDDAELMAFLTAQGETTGYSTYWVSYPLAFRSGEQLIFAPRLPYHADMRYTERDDRYAPYTAWAAAAERTAYITARNPALDERLRAEFAALGLTWQEQVIGDYRVYYRLSAAVHPAQIGLGRTAQ